MEWDKFPRYVSCSCLFALANCLRPNSADETHTKSLEAALRGPCFAQLLVAIEKAQSAGILNADLPASCGPAHRDLLHRKGYDMSMTGEVRWRKDYAATKWPK